MKVLVFGPSGSGKTYVSKALRTAGINAFDADEIEGLSNWYDRDGKKVTTPTTADEALNNGYSFLWSKKFLIQFLDQYPDIYIFGGSGNMANVFNLFDKVYFLKVDPDLQKKRLQDPSRPTPLMDANDDGVVVWGDWLEQWAKQQNIPFVDADQTPDQIYKIISAG